MRTNPTVNRKITTRKFYYKAGYIVYLRTKSSIFFIYLSKDKLTRMERWDTVMYVRYVLFGLPQDYEDIMTKFGSNCAVCHGTRGFADGPIHYYLNPPPANFNQFDRLYEKTDEKLFEEISNGIPWTAMPPWAGRVDKDKHFEFDDKFRWELVKFVRQFGYVTEKDVLRNKELFEHKKSMGEID